MTRSWVIGGRQLRRGNQAAERKPPHSVRPSEIVNRLIQALCFSFLLALPVRAGADLVRPLKSAATREQLVTHFGATMGFGRVEKWEFSSAGRDLMVFWYCPYSGRAACYLHAYSYDHARRAWILFIDRVLEPATRPSAELRAADRSLTFKDRDGRVVVKEYLESLPR